MYLYTEWWLCTANPICLRLFWHWLRAAASRTFCTAGTKSAIKMAMIAITTSSSIKVKAERFCGEQFINGNSICRQITNEIFELASFRGQTVFSRRLLSLPWREATRLPDFPEALRLGGGTCMGYSSSDNRTR